MNIKKYLLKAYFEVRTCWVVWFYLLNRKPRVLFNKNKPALSPVGNRVLEDLKRDGISTVKLEELFPNKSILSDFEEFIKTLNPEEAEQGKKSFLKKYWDKFPKFNKNNPFAKFALSKEVMDIANSYMGMWTKLVYYDLALTLPVGESTPVQSQRWHRDPEEKRICKVFIYLNDINENAGPFTHINGSQRGGKYGKLFPQKPPEGVYPEEKELLSKVDPKDIRLMTAPKGTVIFCDTSGLHRGGYAKTEERLMFTAFFSAPTNSEKPWYKISKEQVEEMERPEQKFALSFAKEK
ncbi:MAG: phytanoyl-CoA dioxygenase family protein [Candidatus Pacebacteria bacterium]|nr:phytanoyl-CoA dioxygenase family protein [Candidatus Paceibacterota bacterium]MBP9058046.1 phytanoyl-CoA dioxygenase family protein [Candidatus Paceibacterota bacterium]MBP9770049.1 phytanoyl-CoA dioxygenase family protein [Candidatus Paceibacterota bacterium]